MEQYILFSLIIYEPFSRILEILLYNLFAQVLCILYYKYFENMLKNWGRGLQLPKCLRTRRKLSTGYLGLEQKIVED